jgi:dynein assembly factor 1
VDPRAVLDKKKKPDEEDIEDVSAMDTNPMTFAKLVAICKQHDDLYEQTEINEKLYLQYGGFTSIGGLEKFEKLGCLWMQNNFISRIVGLDVPSCANHLQQLYLMDNNLHEMEGLESLVHLTDLVLRGNNIREIKGIRTLERLVNLDLSDNQISCGFDELLTVPNLKNLHLHKNVIVDEVVLDVVEHKPKLTLLTLKNNPLVNNVKPYRKTVVARVESLNFLDDRAVTEIERISCTAFFKGGIEAERKARADFQETQRKQQMAQHEQWIKDRIARKNVNVGGRTDFGGKITSVDEGGEHFGNGAFTDGKGLDGGEDDNNYIEAETRRVDVEQQQAELNAHSDNPVALSSAASPATTNANAPSPASLSSSSSSSSSRAVWTVELDEQLLSLCAEHSFDFSLVANGLKQFMHLKVVEFSEDVCRQRYEGLAAIEDSSSSDEDSDM